MVLFCVLLKFIFLKVNECRENVVHQEVYQMRKKGASDPSTFLAIPGDPSAHG